MPSAFVCISAFHIPVKRIIIPCCDEFEEDIRSDKLDFPESL